MGEFLDFLFIIIFVIYIVRSLIRLLLPMLFQKVVNKAQSGQQQSYRRQEQPTGRIKVDYIPEGTKSKVPDSEGEFVDYEEIK